MPIVKMGGDDKNLNYNQVAQPPRKIPATASEAVNKVLPKKNVYETIEIVNRDQQLDKITQYIAGEEWTVDYYLQLVAKDMEIGRFDSNSPDVSRQYLHMKEMILYVDTALTQNEANELTGSAFINAGVIPNSGDVIVATLMGKRKALIGVTKVEKRTYNLNNVFFIEYKLDMFLDNNDGVLNALNNKVSKTYYFDKDFLITNGSPILLEEDFKNKRKIVISIKDIINNYFELMFNSERAILSIPGQDFTIIDTMLQEFIFKVINSTDSIYISRIARNTLPDDIMRQPTILDAFIHRDFDILRSCNRKIKYMNVISFENNIRLRNMAYLGIQYVAYPDSPDTNIMTTKIPMSTTHTLKDVTNPYRVNKGLVDNLIPNIDKEENYYILSKAFYEDDRVNMSKFETICMQYIIREHISNEAIVELIDDYKYWDRVQQYYFIPVLILILRDTINKTSNMT